MSVLALTIAQYEPRPTAAENLAAMVPIVQEAATAGSALVVFPEYSQAFVSEFGEHWAREAQDERGEFVAGLTVLAEQHSLIIVAGMLRQSSSRAKPCNTIVAVGGHGLVASADKVHLYDAFGAQESTWISPGELTEPSVFKVAGVTLGMMACYDLRFPEVSRRLVDAGAEVVVVPAQWVPGEHKAHQWQTLLAARAIESQVFVVAVDHPTPNGVGLSQVVDPFGNVVVTAGTGSEVLHAVVDTDQVAMVRAANPMALQRRFTVAPL